MQTDVFMHKNNCFTKLKKTGLPDKFSHIWAMVLRAFKYFDSVILYLLRLYHYPHINIYNLFFRFFKYIECM